MLSAPGPLFSDPDPGFAHADSKKLESVCAKGRLYAWLRAICGMACCVINYGGERRLAEVDLHERADRLIQLIRPDPSPEFSRTRVPGRRPHASVDPCRAQTATGKLGKVGTEALNRLTIGVN